jgi:hypothetical protein
LASCCCSLHTAAQNNIRTNSVGCSSDTCPDTSVRQDAERGLPHRLSHACQLSLPP